MGNQADNTNSTDWTLIFLSWLVAAVSTLASLFFSEVMELVPCVLCWYQRICIFPLALILLAGLFPLDRQVVRYALPLAMIGLIITIYHTLLFYGFIPESMQPCREGISCKDDSMVLFGMIPIPLLSLAAFSIITTMLIIIRKRSGK